MCHVAIIGKVEGALRTHRAEFRISKGHVIPAYPMPIVATCSLHAAFMY